jgi:hypothetical protein
MATVYKIELELVSDWVNYTPERLLVLIQEILHREEKAQVSITKIDVKRK